MKNRTMKIAAVLLVLTLMTSCFVGGTFAKYTTADSGSDIARVAKWGVEITPNGTVFEKLYATDVDVAILAKQNSVVSSDEWNVVAPGTDDSLTKVQLSGKPEVAYKVSFDATVTLANWTVNGDEYFPVYFTIGSETYGHKTCGQTLTHSYDTIDELKAALENALEKISAVYGANVDLTTVDTPELNWEWPFSTSTDNDVKDTALGDAATENNYAVIKIEIKTTVTQIN